MRSIAYLVSVALFAFVYSCTAVAQQASEAQRGPDELDLESTRLLREHTTDPRFLTEWVDHIPESDTVPSPRDFLGYVIGTPGELTHPTEILAYFRELERTSDRVRIISLGKSHGGREMIMAAIAAPEILARIGDIQAANRRLADPRGTTRDEARIIAATTPATYYITAGLHSPELGPPEMVMELAYRLAVSEQDHVQEIRETVLTLITPVLEMDGRARTVEWNRRYLKEVTDLDDAPPRSPPYWGDYTYHDNNRDGLQASQPLTRNFTDAFHEYLPTVSLDLHESVPLLYVSTGTGPYNETIDPITITEWQWMASYDVSQATKLGLPGVWSWGFYTGWYPGYLLWVTNNHNAVGRFYETFGNGVAATLERDLKNASYADERVNSRQWYRALPPEKSMTWGMRNNTNYMQTGVLAALQLAARNGDTLLFNFWQKGANALAKGQKEKPYAFHIPVEQRDAGTLRHLLWLLDQHRIEVHRASSEIVVGDLTIAAGDFLVRMDQPYRNLAKTLFEPQRFPRSAEHSPYDDISWCLKYMLGIEANAIDEPEILTGDMVRVQGVPELIDVVEASSRPGSGPFLIEHRGQASLASLCWRLPEGAGIQALKKEWNDHPAGSLVIRGVSRDDLQALTNELLLDVQSFPADATPPMVEVDLPRIALYHTWRYTQDSGWARYALEQLGIPYTLIEKDDVKAGGLRARFDVILVPNTGRMALKDLVHGVDAKWSPMPYTRTDEYPSHGVIDFTDDMTGGMGFRGLEHLHMFAKRGGLLVTLANAGVLAADSGIANAVSTRPAGGTPGSHVTTKVLRPEHPVTWGYPELTHAFHGNVRSFSVPEHLQGRVLMQYGTKTRAEAEAEADRKADIPAEEQEPVEEEKEDEPEAPEPKLCLSGLVRDADAIERAPALLDVPVEEGRVLFFSWNPLHRYQNHHDFAFLTNALLFHDDFPGTPTEEEMLERETP